MIFVLKQATAVIQHLYSFPIGWISLISLFSISIIAVASFIGAINFHGISKHSSRYEQHCRVVTPCSGMGLRLIWGRPRGRQKEVKQVFII